MSNTLQAIDATHRDVRHSNYKVTEIGSVPADWALKRFDEVFDFLPTATNSRADLSPDGNVYYIHYGDIHTRFHGHLDFEKHVPPRIDSMKCRNAARIKNGDWIMADASEDIEGVGKSVEVSGLEGEAVSGLHTYLLREKSSVFVPGFKGHLAASPHLRAQYARAMTGMKVFGVSKAALRRLMLLVPPKPEQRMIADALSDLDRVITDIENLICKKRLIRQALAEDILTGRRRLPEFADSSPLTVDELGARPASWRAEPLIALVDPARGIRYGIVQPGLYDPDGRFMIRGQDYSEAKGWADQSEFSVSALL